MAKESSKRRQSIDIDTDLLKEMVTMAFQGSKVDKLTTEDIYKAVFKNFPNLGSQKKAKLQKLKTSIRTVLSRYECFSKMERALKGNYWQFNEDVSGDAKRKPASRLPHVNDSSLELETKTEESDNAQRETGVVTRRERRRRKANKSPAAEIKPPDKEELKESAGTKSEEHSKEVDMKEDDSVTDDKSKTDSLDTPESKGEEPAASPPVVDKPAVTCISTQPSDGNAEETSLKEDPKTTETGINGVSTTIHKPVANPVSLPLPQSSPVPFGHPSSPTVSHFGRLPPSSTHFGQPPASNHSFGSSSSLSNSYGQLSPSFGPPPNYQFGSYCAPNGQFGLPNSQLGYSTSHFGYTSVPVGMPNSHFGYSPLPSNQFYASPPTHPFGLPSPFHHYPAGHPSNFSPFNTAGSLPHSPNRF